MNDDERLKQTFDKLRADDARRAPSFESALRKRPRRRSGWAVVVPLASAAAAAAAFVVWCSASEGPQTASVAAPSPVGAAAAPPPLAAPDHRAAPLDFLLDVPGLRGAPDFDTSLLRGSLR